MLTTAWSNKIDNKTFSIKNQMCPLVPWADSGKLLVKVCLRVGGGREPSAYKHEQVYRLHVHI